MPADGDLDITFSIDGKTTTEIGSTSDDTAKSVAIQTDGKMIVVGTSNAGDSINFAVVRYNTDGTLDTTFSTDGKTTTDIGTSSNDIGRSVAIQATGEIIVAGNSRGSGDDEFAVVRYNTDGTLDTTFSTDGKTTTDIGTSSRDTATSVAIQATGEIIVAGNALTGSHAFAVIRYNTDGTLDTNFSTDGKTTIDIGASISSVKESVAIQTDGKIVAVGNANTGGSDDFVVLRYNTDGTLDTTFSTDGITSTDFDIGIFSEDYARSVAIQTDGRIVVAGYTNAGGSDDFSVVRYNAIPLSVTLDASTATASTASITFTMTGNGTVDCTMLSTTPGVDFNLIGISAITLITQTSPTVCTISATSSAAADGVAISSGLTAAPSFSIGFTNGNVRTTIGGSSQSVTVTIPAVAKDVVPTTTTVAPSTTLKRPRSLPATGSNSSTAVMVGILLVLSGLVLMSRRRISR